MSPVDAVMAANMVEKLGGRLRPAQVHRAATVVKELREGVQVPLVQDLLNLRVPNTASLYKYGEQFTDALAGWLKKCFVAGSFAISPYKDQRINSMIAVEQKNKVRIVMNLSGPKGASFNDAVDENRLEKVVKSTARQYGYSLIECGVGARQWKWDMEDAYKNMQAALEDCRLQGFTWLGALFF